MNNRFNLRANIFVCFIFFKLEWHNKRSNVFIENNNKMVQTNAYLQLYLCYSKASINPFYIAKKKHVVSKLLDINVVFEKQLNES